VVVPRLASDLAVHCAEAATGRLETPVRFRDDACVTVVLASEGYPTAPVTGDLISGLDEPRDDDVIVFHAGTARTDDGVVTAGGRVLAVTALGADVAVARTKAYAAADAITWRGKYCRRDIAAAPST
jgi:phosphoribosylamine--glycine ligase